jgi:hypothetical protein
VDARPEDAINEHTPNPGDSTLHGVTHSELLAEEARRLAGELVATRRSMKAAGRPDPALMARMCHCYDRLDDIAEVIGQLAVQQIYTSVSLAANT